MEHEKVIASSLNERAAALSHARHRPNSTSEALTTDEFAKSAGADGALMVAPYYNKPTQEGYYATSRRCRRRGLADRALQYPGAHRLEHPA